MNDTFDAEDFKMAMDFTSLQNSKLPLVIYHGNCADGFSAAWVFYHMQDKIEQAFEFHSGVYGETPPDCSDRIVYLVDFSYKKDVVKEICSKAIAVWLIDHHKTAIEDLGWLIDEGSSEYQKNFHWFVDLERSGAMLAWDYWHNTEWDWVAADTHTGKIYLISEKKPDDPFYTAPPILLEHVQDRDLWRFKLPGTREIQAAVFSYEYTFENWDRMMSGETIDKLQLWKEGAAIERKHHKDIAELVKTCQRILRLADHDVPVASLPYTLASDAGHLMATEYKDGAMFAATYYDTAEHRVFSLRSTERGMDVSEVAKSYGGGGHKHAAGFKVPRTHYLAMV